MQPGTPDSSGRSARFIWLFCSVIASINRINPVLRPNEFGVPRGGIHTLFLPTLFVVHNLSLNNHQTFSYEDIMPKVALWFKGREEIPRLAG